MVANTYMNKAALFGQRQGMVSGQDGARPPSPYPQIRSARRPDPGGIGEVGTPARPAPYPVRVTSPEP